MVRVLPRRLAYGEEATLVEHLGELRTRVVVCLLTLVVSFAVTYSFRGHVLHWLNAPLPHRLQKPVTFGVAEPFLTSVWVSFWAGLLILVAVLTQHVESVLNAAFDLRGLTSGALLGGLLLAVFWKKARARPVIAAMAASVSVMIVINWFLKGKVFWPWYTLIGTLVTVSVTFSRVPLFASAAAKDRAADEPKSPE